MKRLQGHNRLDGQRDPFFFHAFDGVFGNEKIVFDAAHPVLDDLHFRERGYQPWPAYGQSKLANLLFTFELQRRCDAEGLDVTASAAHPGWTGTDLQRNSWLARTAGLFIAMRPASSCWCEPGRSAGPSPRAWARTASAPPWKT